MRDGQGEEVMHYMGDFKRGRRHGSGTWQGGDGGCFYYCGGWRDGFMSGQGLFSWRQSGHKFEGVFREGCPVSGVITTAGNRRLRVSFAGCLACSISQK